MLLNEEQPGIVVKIFHSCSKILVQRVLVEFLVKPKIVFIPSLLTPLMHLTCGAGAVDDKDFTVSSNQGMSDCSYTKPLSPQFILLHDKIGLLLAV